MENTVKEKHRHNPGKKTRCAICMICGLVSAFFPVSCTRQPGSAPGRENPGQSAVLQPAGRAASPGLQVLLPAAGTTPNNKQAVVPGAAKPGQPVQQQPTGAASVIGYSVTGVQLTVKELGQGKERALILVGGIHGDEANTVLLVEKLGEKYSRDPGLLPLHTTLFLLPCLNPDGYAARSHENHNRADLNHNFPTADWQAAALGMTGAIVPGLGGSAPGSEPEVRAFADWLLSVIKPQFKAAWVLAFHSAAPPVGYIQPGYVKNGVPDPGSAELAQKAARAAGYKYLAAWVDKAPITGELIHFCVMNGLQAMDVELPTYAAPEIVPGGKKESTLAGHERMLDILLALEPGA